MTEVFDAYAAYYDLLYRDKDYRGEAEYIHSLLAGHGVESGELLELGCGTGKHAEQLARLGHSVHGIDSSEPMVELARTRTPPDLEARLRFDVGDVRSVRVDSRFDAIISLFHVVSYQATNQDLAAMFATASAHLKAGGIFIFDFWYGPGVLTDPPTVRVKRLHDGNVAIIRIAEPTLWANDNLVDVHYTMLVMQTGTGAVAEIQETHRMRYLFLPELKSLLQAAGMELLQAEGWMSGAELGCGSWQAVVTARRSAASWDATP
jgi:SAM-dependent methyltransferase